MVVRSRSLRTLLGGRLSTPSLVLGVLASGVALTAGALILDMSGSAPRTAGSDFIHPQEFAVVLGPRGQVCQGIGPIPYDAARARVLIGTYGRPVPPITMSFSDAARRPVARASVSGGAQGYVNLPIHTFSSTPAVSVCLRNGGTYRVALGGAPVASGPALVNGKLEHVGFTILYFRHGSENWWQLLPVIDLRFGLGKAPFFGRWTLPVVAALALLLWIGVMRLIARELRRDDL
jgi:hypothetical protein